MKRIFDVRAELIIWETEEMLHLSVAAQLPWKAYGADCVKDADASGNTRYLEIYDKHGAGLRTES